MRHRIRRLHLLTMSAVILMLDGIVAGPKFSRRGYRSLVAQ